MYRLLVLFVFCEYYALLRGILLYSLPLCGGQVVNMQAYTEMLLIGQNVLVSHYPDDV